MIITLAGQPGAGKSTVAKVLATMLGYRHQSTGDMRRAVWKAQGKLLEDLNKENEDNPELDKAFDASIAELGKNDDDFVMDSWMAWHFIPHSLKVYLTVPPELAAKRIFENQRPTEQQQDSVETMQTVLHQRHMRMRDRYRAAYSVTITDQHNYDVIIATENKTPEEVARLIIAAADAHARIL